MPATMHAAVRRTYSPPKYLQISDLPLPSPAPEELLVRVCATTVNRTDLAVLTGYPLAMRLFTGLIRPKRIVPGTDFAGVVEAVGERVTRFCVGDRVWGFEDRGIASQAQYMAVPVAAVEAIPEGLSFQEAAASAEGAHYALNFLNKLSPVAGQQVLVNGGTGAIGSALVQLLRYQGLEVTATCPTGYVERVKALGAVKVIDFQQEDFTRLPLQFDYVFDAVGKSTFRRCARLLKPDGVYISSELGPGWQNIWLALLTPLRPGKRVIFPIPGNIQASLRTIRDLLERGEFRPLIDRIYPLEDIAEAYDYVKSGRKIGNVVLDLDQTPEQG
ncbi:MAG TPA: NAD(P)-dependent alcohol dehydrogenase [Saprospiraceae bacterium]|nr:NAD(P)-dependent alcohol dehydrogenase [Saprospiraceae bacterium]